MSNRSDSNLRWFEGKASFEEIQSEIERKLKFEYENSGDLDSPVPNHHDSTKRGFDPK